jgi:hypothetical protein
MGKRSPLTPGSITQLILRGRRPQTLVETEEDWLAVGAMAERMLFWCGGSILGARCERNEIHFALQLGRASVGAMAHHLSAAYGTRMRRERGWRGATFRPYRLIPWVDEDLDGLVRWLHRPAEANEPVFTAEAAYLTPATLSWINPLPVLRASRGNASSAESPRFTFGAIVRAVADHCGVALEDMRSETRKRAVAKAKIIATVLAARNGATVAAAARYFNRNRSTLIEQAERYRLSQPELFTKAEIALAAVLERIRPARE